MTHRRLGELLQERTSLDAERLARALKLQENSDQRLGSLLVQLGMVAERDLAEALGSQLGLPVAKPDAYPDTQVAEDAVSPEFLHQSKAVPIHGDDTSVSVAMADPLDRYTLDALRLALGREISPWIGVVADIESAIARQFGDGASRMSQLAGGMATNSAEPNVDDIQHLRDLASEAPIIRMVNLVVGKALEARASDIHIEPFDNRLKVRYRIDGALKEVEAPPVRSTAAVVSRVKVMANLNIAERRLPQDGRITMRIEGREIDMRISTVPTMHGERSGPRILDTPLSEILMHVQAAKTGAA